MQEPSEEDPEVKRVEQSSEEPSFVFEGILETSDEDLLERPKLVADVVVLHAELAALRVFGLQPLYQARLVDVLQAAFAVANLLQKDLVLDELSLLTADVQVGVWIVLSGCNR